MTHSITWRFIVIALLTLLMAGPLFFAADIINERAQYSRSTISSVSQEWGGVQTLGAPVLVIPVEADVIRTRREDVINPKTNLVVIDPDTKKPYQKVVREKVTETRDPIYLSPQNFELALTSRTEERHRGLFKVPVYRAGVTAAFHFDKSELTRALRNGERMRTDQTQLWFQLGVTRALRGDAALTHGGQPLRLEPLAPGDHGRGGVRAFVGKKALEGAFKLTFGTNGAQRLSLSPSGRRTKITMQSDWPHPSFAGAFLPDESEITDDGFSAGWTIPNLSLNLPQISRTSQDRRAQSTSEFHVLFYQPNDFYQKAFRAGRYGMLFIALTFLAVLLVERHQARAVHPFQYIMIGLAQSLFVVLMVALAEQIGFLVAYWLATGATVGLIAAYGVVGLKLGRGALALGGGLLGIYGILFVILQAQDTALLAGAILSFAALAAIMFATRNEDWSGRTSGGLWSRLRKSNAKPNSNSADTTQTQ